MMIVLIKIAECIAALIVVFGFALIVKKDFFSTIIRAALHGKNIRYIAVFRGLYGILLAYVSQGARSPAFVLVIGVILFLSAVAVFILPEERSKNIVLKIAALDSATQKIVKAAPIFLGILIICSL
ncbi:MAG TPA: hypothetical protein PKY78_08040 [Candidatus Omnitrophota bacterium]|nr:hypothetical protein [Candidatus Omnitrophota bacterium]HPS20918.1 hypothetical protein [Candidatus Omnitrophota bacterium]